MDRKTRSEKVLKKHKILINPTLSRIANEEEARLKSPEEIVKRGVTAFLTCQIAIDILGNNGAAESIEFFTPILERFGLREELTEDEKPYFDLSQCDNNTGQQAKEMQWRLEMCAALFWACGFIKKLPYPSEMIDTTKQIFMINGCKNFAELMKNVKMRSLSEILDATDLIFRMNWACVEARVKNDPSIMGDLFSDVVWEQHKGFNWLIGAYDADDWDTVNPHT